MAIYNIYSVFNTISKIIDDEYTFVEINETHALNNALEYFKECLKDSSLSRDIKDEIRISSTQCRNLQAKFNKFCSQIRVR